MICDFSGCTQCRILNIKRCKKTMKYYSYELFVEYFKHQSEELTRPFVVYQ